MRKHIIMGLALLCMMLCSCAGLNDWVSDPLSGDYVLVRSSGYDITLCREQENGSYSILINALIYQVAYSDAYICVQQVDPPVLGKRLPIDPSKSWYIVKVEDGSIYGPYTGAEYDLYWADMPVSAPDNWTYAKDLRPEQ